MSFPLVISGSMHILCIVFFNTCKNKASESVSGLSDLDSGLKFQWKQTVYGTEHTEQYFPKGNDFIFGGAELLFLFHLKLLYWSFLNQWADVQL